jgi:hypothetical protein
MPVADNAVLQVLNQYSNSVLDRGGNDEGELHTEARIASTS